MAGIKSFVKQIDPGNRDVTQTQSNVNSAVQQIAQLSNHRWSYS